jgi:CelD/BcsL family acetyltransferase involved in cellulose biosynthesis
MAASPPTAAPSTAAAPLTCTVLTDLEQLQQLAPAWDALLARSSSNEPVLSPLWMLNWWRVFGAEGRRELRAGCFFRREVLVGLAPLVRRRAWHRSPLPFRRLEPLGTGEPDADAIHPDYLSLIVERGAEEGVASAFAAALSAGAFGRCDELVIPAMDAANPLLPPLTAALSGVGLRCTATETAVASYVPLPATWDEYLAALSYSRRAALRQALRKFDAWSDGEARWHCATTTAELEEGARALKALHGQRWAGGGKFGSPHFNAFHDATMPALLAAGALELLWLTVRGEPVAAAYNIVWDNKVYFYQCGRKTDVPSAVRLGIIQSAHAIRRAIEAGRREYDFLGGGEQYKQQLALGTRPLVEFRAARRGLAEGVRVVSEAAIGIARRLRNAARSAWRSLRRHPA